MSSFYKFIILKSCSQHKEDDVIQRDIILNSPL